MASSIALLLKKFSIGIFYCPRSLMDRTRVCGTRNPGPIPGEGTTTLAP